MNVPEDLHRYSHATFHDGAHRQAPGDSTPWRDAASPFNKVKAWWIAPAAKGSIIAAWSVTMVIGSYCYALQQDAKSTYMLNNVLLRNLHQESLRADANEDRASELQQAVKSKIIKEEKMKIDHKSSLKQCSDSKEELRSGLVNYELELSRERARSDVVHDRNQLLVKELHQVRTDLHQAKKENTKLVDEVDRLRKIVRRLESN